MDPRLIQGSHNYVIRVCLHEPQETECVCVIMKKKEPDERQAQHAARTERNCKERTRTCLCARVCVCVCVCLSVCVCSCTHVCVIIVMKKKEQDEKQHAKRMKCEDNYIKIGLSHQPIAVTPTRRKREAKYNSAFLFWNWCVCIMKQKEPYKQQAQYATRTERKEWTRTCVWTRARVCMWERER